MCVRMCTLLCRRHILLCGAATAFPVLSEFSFPYGGQHVFCAFAASPIVSVWLPQLSFSLLFITSRASITSRLDSSMLVPGVKEKGKPLYYQ